MTCLQATVDNLIWLEFLYQNVTSCTLYIFVHAFVSIMPRRSYKKPSKSLFVRPCKDWIASPFRVCGGMLYTQKSVCIVCMLVCAFFWIHRGWLQKLPRNPSGWIVEISCALLGQMMQRGNCLGKQKVAFVCLCVPYKSCVLLFSIVVVAAVVIVAAYLAGHGGFVLASLIWLMLCSYAMQGSFGPHFPGHVLIWAAWPGKNKMDKNSHFCSRHSPLSEGSRRS